jgi:hypothetical protein
MTLRYFYPWRKMFLIGFEITRTTPMEHHCNKEIVRSLEVIGAVIAT